MSKTVNYTIIDHLGTIENTNAIRIAYKQAYELTAYPKETFTLKRFCQMLSGNEFANVSDKQKNLVRFTKNPNQVIIITPDKDAIKTKWYIDNWAEKTNNLIVIEAQETTERISIETFTIQDLYPEWFATLEATNSRFRRCASIWASALGWSFSAPLYRDNERELDEMYLARPDRKLYADNLEMSGHITKISTKPATYIKNKIQVASEQECKDFFEYYAYLQKNNLLKEFLLPGYDLCPHCGRPIRCESDADRQVTCNWCDTQIQATVLDTYYEDAEL